VTTKTKTKLEKYFDNINFLAQELAHEKESNQYLYQKMIKIQQSFPWKCYKILKAIFKHPIKMFISLFPIKQRKRILRYLSRIIIFNKRNQISYALEQEWKKSIREQPKEIKHDILIFGLISWNFRFQRPQQLATELSKLGHRVFFIEHEFIPQLPSHNGFQAIETEKIDQNLYRIKISSSAKHFIYNDSCTPKDVKIMLGSIKTLINKAKIINPVAIIEHPFWTDLAQKLSMPLIYDCMDNHSGFSETSQENINKEKILANITKFNTCTSEFLLKHLNTLTSNQNILIGNGVNLKDFVFNKLITPPDINNLTHPIIGYYGALSNWFDTVLLEKVAKKYNKDSIVLIGEVSNPKITKLAKKYSNIKLLGEKKYQEIPAYLKAFDVSLIPFKINPLIKATNPVKIYEYFSQGKAVVSTYLPELKKYQSLLYLSKTHTNFLENIDLALKEKTDKLNSRKEIALSNQWTDKAKEISKHLNTFFQKVSVVILTYNGTQMSKDSIDTVLNRSFYPNKEVIVVDNASQPDTVKMLKKYQNNPEIKLILNKENYGFAKGNNIGTRLATGDYIVLLNNDILATPGWIERLVFHVNKSNVGLVGPVTNSIGNEAKIDIEYDHTNQKQMEKRVHKYTSKHWGETMDLRNLAAFCWICPKHVYDQIGELDERFGRGMFEDDDYCYRIKKAGYQILCADDAFIHHFGGASFKKIVSQEYIDLFEANKKKFEDKWHTKWIAHQYRKELK
jgi:GT2 family glycosyltransferase